MSEHMKEKEDLTSGDLSWNPAIDSMLAKWCDQAKCFEWMHTTTYSEYDRKSRIIMIASNVLTAVSGLSNVLTGGVVIDGKIQLGANGAAGEIAHQIIKFDGPMCGCGAQGCAEPLTNSAAIAKLAGTKTAEEAYKNAVAGDEKALAAFKEVAYWIAITLTNIMVVLAPDTIIIGGGVAQSGDILLNEIRAAMHERAHLYDVSEINIVPATLGFYAGSIGAGLYGAITAGAQLSLISTT